MMRIDGDRSWYSHSDLAIIQELGAFLQQERLRRNWTQAHLAELTGLDRSTISQIENGRISSMLSFIQILRALERLDVLNQIDAKQPVSPMKMLKLEQEQRRRARSGRSDQMNNSSTW